jgi:hypothetical protein
MHDRLQSVTLLNNVIKTILPRSIGLFELFFLTNSGHCSDVRSFFLAYFRSSSILEKNLL